MYRVWGPKWRLAAQRARGGRLVVAKLFNVLVLSQAWLTNLQPLRPHFRPDASPDVLPNRAPHSFAHVGKPDTRANGAPWRGGAQEPGTAPRGWWQIGVVGSRHPRRGCIFCNLRKALFYCY